jgi:integrating conjugative element relaxase (TIGR03760 family)
VREAVLFQRQRKNTQLLQTKPLKDLAQMVTPAQFLADEKRSALLKKIKSLSGLEASRYGSLCAVLVDNLVDYCQSLPEASNSYYSDAGGIVNYALNRTEAALSLLQEFMISEQPGQLSEEQKLWQYALHTAAILQGIGKIFVDYRILLFDVNGQLLKQWNPLLEPMVATGSYYDYELLKEPDVAFRCRLNLLLAKLLMPVSGFAWIASNAKVLAVWLALLNEDMRGAGTLGAILIRADAMAIQRYLSVLSVKVAMTKGAGRYGRTGTFSVGTGGSITDKEQAIGIEFINWLQEGLASGMIIINKAPLFMVPGGFLMSKEMFQWFVREHPEYKNWQAIQNGFVSLGLHSRDSGGAIESRFEQGKTNEIYSGMVFTEYAVALSTNVQVYQIATGKVETLSAIELIHKAQYPSIFTEAHQIMSSSLVQKLSANGHWQIIDSVSGDPQVRLKPHG